MSKKAQKSSLSVSLPSQAHSDKPSPMARAKICPNFSIHAGNRAIRAGFVDFFPADVVYLKQPDILRSHHFFSPFKGGFCMLSYRKLAMRVLGHPLHTGGIDSPRPASQRAAAFVLTAAMLTTLAAPAFADIWHIENGDITDEGRRDQRDEQGLTGYDHTTYGGHQHHHHRSRTRIPLLPTQSPSILTIRAIRWTSLSTT